MRPTSVTIISWFLIVSALISVVSGWYLFTGPDIDRYIALTNMPRWLLFVSFPISLVCAMVSGIAMLKGRAWGRQLYIGYNLISLALSAEFAPSKLLMLPSALVVAIVILFLYRASANRYFAAVPDLTGARVD